jgi:hypothetical protein
VSEAGIKDLESGIKSLADRLESRIDTVSDRVTHTEGYEYATPADIERCQDTLDYATGSIADLQENVCLIYICICNSKGINE